MLKFTTQTSKGLPLNMDNVDTDQIIPAQHISVKSVEEGLKNYVFHNLRQNQNFVLNKEEHKGSAFVIAGHNFGCGSSREHAPWALIDYGFTAVIAISFADIFRNNSLKNGLLLVELKENEIKHIHEEIEKNSETKITINLEEQSVNLENGSTYHFEIETFRKNRILKGQDDLDYIMSFEDKIKKYEEKTPVKGVNKF